MGLYRRAHALLNAGESKNTTAIPLDDLFTRFRHFAESGIVERFAVLAELSGSFKIAFSCGLNAQTVRKSVSTRDFWNGTIENGEWYRFTGRQLTPFYQFFSAADTAFLTELHIKKLEDTFPQSICIVLGSYENATLNKLVSDCLPFVKSLNAVSPYVFTENGGALSVRMNVKRLFEHSSFCAGLYLIRLNKLFESLSAVLLPSDFAFIEDALLAAVRSACAFAPRYFCRISEEKALIYAVLGAQNSEEFGKRIKKSIQALFENKRSSLITAEFAGKANDGASLLKLIEKYDNLP